MLSLNIEFQEEYKRLDRLCRDCLSSSEGVSEYIRQMEATPFGDRRYTASWQSDYEQLKHVRWVRNQLAHEVGSLNSDICTRDDLEWVQNFYTRIMKGGDPFSVVRKAKEAERQRLARQRKDERQMRRDDGNEPVFTRHEPVPRKSLWKRIADKIKSLFR